MKLIRKLTIGFCALVLVLGMAAAVNAASATITIPNAVAGQTYDAYRVFDYTPPDNEGGKGYYTLSAKFSGLPSYTYYYDQDKSVSMSSFFTVGENDILDTSGLATDDDFNLFAKAVVAFAEANGIANDGSTIATEDCIETISVSEEGFYVVRSSLGNKVSYDYVLDGGAVIEEKNKIPSIDMKVTGATNSSAVYSDQTGNDAQIGDRVVFEITADLKKGGRDYAIVDTSTPGLTLQDIQDSNVSFSNDNIGYAIDNRYDDENGNKGFKITFDGEPAADTTVTVECCAIVNKDAVIAAGENINETFLIYGNGTETTHVTTKTMTYPLQLKKIKEGDSSEKILPGAEFQINREFDKATIHFTKISDTEYKVDPEGTVTEINTVAETPITLLGLGAEHYIIVETNAPQGYNLLGSSVTVDGTELKHAQRVTVSTTSSTDAVQIGKIEDPQADVTDNGVKYRLNDDRTATVSGYTDELPGDVTIPPTITFNNQRYTVTSIKQYAFLGCEGLTSISIPKDVISVEGSAFYRSGLTTVTFEEGSNLTSIGPYAFCNCKNLEKITIPKGVTSIEESTFEGCSDLTTVTFEEGSNLTSIGKSAFYECKKLNTITIPESVTSVGSIAFWKCTSLETITIPKGVTSIGESIFLGSGLTTVTFEEGSNLTSIGNSAFDSCKKLNTITIPESVTSIGESAFDSCAKLETIIIPASVTSIGDSAFSGCRSLSTVTIPASVTSMGENAFHWSGLTTVTFEEGSNLTTIKQDAFSDCFSLTTVTIPESVKSIESNAFTNAPLKTIYYLGARSQWEAITGDGKPMNVTVHYAKEDPAKMDNAISIEGAKVALSAESFTYNGKVLKPTIRTIGGKTLNEGTDYTVKWSMESPKNVGAYIVTITGTGNYTGTTEATYKINPKGTKIKKLQKVKKVQKVKKAVTVKWKKQKTKMAKSRITGYQIQIATNKKFTKNKKTITVKGYKKTSKEIKKLKSNKKYYVHVRTYKTVKGVKYYSPWSAFKTVTTK